MDPSLEAEDPVAGQMIGLRSLMARIRRSHRVWLLTGLVGLLIGVTLDFVVPHKYKATTELYLSQPAGANSLEAMAGNVSLLETEAVARQAVTAGDIRMTPSTFLSHYTGLAVSGNLMSITFSGGSQTEAVSGASAVAHAFLTVQARELGLQTDVLVNGMQSQISAVNAAIGTLNNSINSLSNTNSSDQTTNQLADLINRRSADETQVSQLQAQVEQARLSLQSADQVSRVLDPAALVPGSTKKALISDALTGLVAGLVVGLAAVVFSSLFADRTLGRSTIATTLGAPVEMSLERYRLPWLMRRTRLSHRLRKPDRALLMIHRRLRRHLESAPGSALAVIADGTPELTALAVGSMAVALSSEGHRVVVVDAVADRPLAQILELAVTPGYMETWRVPTASGPPMSVMVAPEDPLQMAEKPPPHDTDVLLVQASLDAAFGAEHLTPWVRDAVMILSSRRTTIPRLEVSREMLHEAGIFLRAVILVDADFQDETIGARSAGDLGLAPAETARAAT